MQDFNADFDYEAAQHQDQLLLQQVLLSQLCELHALIDACSDYTWLREEDIRNIAAGCGLYEDYIQAIKPKQEHEHANR